MRHAVIFFVCLALLASPVLAADPGTVWTWGFNSAGELGDNTTTDRHAPVLVVGSGGSGTLTGVAAVAGGAAHMVALKSDGTVWTWGDNTYGELGNNTTTSHSTPVQVTGSGGAGYLTNVAAVAAASSYTVALKSDGTVWTWGGNPDGELGDNTTTQRNAPVQVVGPGGTGHLTGIVAVAAGDTHVVALKSDGTVWTWGFNTNGQLGDNTTTQRLVPVQVVVAVYDDRIIYLRNIVAVGAGADYSVALDSGGAVWAWGLNYFGQLGNNTWVNSATPIQVAGDGGSGYLWGVVALGAAGGTYHTAALKPDGSVWTWGGNFYGELGNGTPANSSNAPFQVVGPGGTDYLTDVVAVSTNLFHSMALKSDGTVWAWGDNSYGDLGDNTTTSRSTTVQVTGSGGAGYLTGIGAIATGYYFSAALAKPLSPPPQSYSLSVTSASASEGVVAYSPSGATGSYGEVVTLSASAVPGYVFTTWTVSGGAALFPGSAQTTLFLTGNTTVVARFAVVVLNGTVNATTGGTATVSNSGPYSYGQVITATASAQAGYIFSGWSVTGASTLSDPAALSTSLTVYDDFLLTANFMVRPLGDINGDGVVDENDLAILNARLNGFDIAPYTDADCDINGDGYVTTADRVLLREILNGLGP